MIFLVCLDMLFNGNCTFIANQMKKTVYKLRKNYLLKHGWGGKPCLSNSVLVCLDVLLVGYGIVSASTSINFDFVQVNDMPVS